MRYLLLIYGPPFDPSTVSEAEQAASMEIWAEFTASLQRQGAMEAGEALTGPETATTIRVREGQLVTTDGPFAETTEVLGGYYVLDVKNLDQAIEIAAACPGAKNGSIELRPILDFGEEYEQAVAQRAKAGRA
jgi:hypothetical protein